MEDRELIIRLTEKVESLVNSVKNVGDKVDKIQDDHIVKTSMDIAVMKEKVSRLENIIYGAITVIFIQIVALLFMFFKK